MRYENEDNIALDISYSDAKKMILGSNFINVSTDIISDRIISRSEKIQLDLVIRATRGMYLTHNAKLDAEYLLVPYIESAVDYSKESLEGYVGVNNFADRFAVDVVNLKQQYLACTQCGSRLHKCNLTGPLCICGAPFKLKSSKIFYDKLRWVKDALNDRAKLTDIILETSTLRACILINRNVNY